MRQYQLAGSQGQDVNGHIEDTLSDLVAGVRGPKGDELEVALNHLGGCVHCQVTLSTLVGAHLYATMADAPVERSQHEAHLLDELASILHDTKAREQLPAYAEAIEREGEEAAQWRYPALAEHLAHCEGCQADLAATRRLLSAAVAEGLMPALLPAEALGPWQHVVESAYRLRERVTVLAGQATVAITSTLPGTITVQLASGQLILSAPQTTVGRAERLILALQEEEEDETREKDDEPRERCYCLLDFSARFDRQLHVRLHVQRVWGKRADVLAPEHNGSPVGGIEWEAVKVDGARRRVMGQGITDATGGGHFLLAWAGEYELAVQVEGATWTIPLGVKQ